VHNVERMRLGVIVERRESNHPWQDHTWQPVAVLAGVPESGARASDWQLLAEGPGWKQLYAGALELELFPKETDAYQINLTSATPVVYVILRPREDAEAFEVEPFHVTVSADEVRDYLDAGGDIIEGVPMPAAVRAWVEGYVARYHRAEAFEKYPRKRWKDEGSARPPQASMRGERSKARGSA